MSLQDDIEKQSRKGLKQFVNYGRLQQRRVLDVLELSAVRLQAQVAKAERKGVIPIFREKVLLDQVRAEIKTLRSSLRRTIKQGMHGAIDAAFRTQINSGEVVGIDKFFKVHLGTSFTAKDGSIVRYNAAKEPFAKSVWAQMNTDAFNAVINDLSGGQTYTARIWNLSHEAQKAMLNQVHSAVLTGQSAASLGRDIRKYLVDPSRRRGRALRDFRPGRGVYKSARANAERVTRTEISRAYHKGTQEYQKRRSWSDGFIWHISPINCCDLCTEREGKFYTPDDLPEIPVHPHCMCWLELHVDPKVAAKFS